MRVFVRLVVWLLGWCVVVGSAMAQGDAEEAFELRVRPVLARRCIGCHGPKKASNGLRLDSRAVLLKGGKRGPAIVAGHANESLLVQAVAQTHDELVMPPDDPLDPAQVADLAAWIDAGAPWPEKSAAVQASEHWAFEPVRKPALPDNAARHPIDRFLAQAHRAHGLTAVGEADRRTLIRRLSFDLLGLPPDPDEVERFAADPHPAAYERLVDRYLASPHYGERWGRHWLDVARYSDTAGDNADYPIPEARLYRDYVIAAFNADKPYDQFVREQLAGDLLEPGDDREFRDATIATGFVALSRRYATGPEELWHLVLEDTIDTTGRAFLALNLRCARCHDHKFDPIPTTDYYALYGTFASTSYPYAGSEEFASMSRPRARFRPLVREAEAAPLQRAHAEEIAALQAAIQRLDTTDPRPAAAAACDQQLALIEPAVAALERVGQTPKALQSHRDALRARRDAARNTHRQERAALAARMGLLFRTGAPPDLPVAYAVAEGKPHDEAVQKGGDPASPGALVKRGVPSFLAAAPPVAVSAQSSGRLELARWLTRPDHPLTARVWVNRVWQHHFGRGLVDTLSNFGVRGARPSHPELLDDLADRFVASGWSNKALHRLIVTSEAYRRSSVSDASNASVDPDNRWLWRYSRRRLEAEPLRDAMLAVSGVLDRQPAGDHPFPPITAWGWTQHNAFKEVYASNHRGVYLMTQRLQRHPYLGLFDGPDANVSTDTRAVSTVPLQALYLMNNDETLRQAAALAERLAREHADSDARIVRAIQLCFGRPPAADEVARYRVYIQEFVSQSTAAGANAADAEREAWTSFARVLLTSNAFLYVD